MHGRRTAILLAIFESIGRFAQDTEERLAGYEQDLFDLREQVEAIMHVHVVALEAFVGELERVEPGDVRKQSETTCLYVGEKIVVVVVVVVDDADADADSK